MHTQELIVPNLVTPGVILGSAAPQTALREVDKELQREYEAIHLVHMHLDDDHDGTVDMRESAEVCLLSVCQHVC